jgi:hypothetical protein
LASVTKEFGFVSEILSLAKRHPTPTIAAKAIRKNLIFMRVICFLPLLRLQNLLERRRIARPPLDRTVVLTDIRGCKLWLTLTRPTLEAKCFEFYAAKTLDQFSMPE